MSQSSVARLFTPFSLGNTTLRNRIAMAPMTRKRSPGGTPTDEVVNYYRRRGEGGIGLIFSEGTFIDHPSAQANDGRAYQNIPHFFGAEALKGWEKVVTAVQETGARFMPQLWHVGEVRRLGMPGDPSVPGYGPREITEDGRVTVKAMDACDVEHIALSYARGARTARELGCDGVALHGAHGYLMDQFLWPESNPRTDDFGGGMAARSRPARTVVAAIRDAVGPDFPIVFRFSQWKMTDYAARIAETPAELEVLLSGLVEAGVDAFDVSTRRFWEAAFDESPRSLAAWTRALSGKPTIAVGSIGLDQPHHSKYFRDKAQIDAQVADLDQLLEAMTRDEFDLASVGRAVLADPQWANKVRNGRMADIRAFERGDLETYK
ncbi:NADH:flavin oxidoreductase [Oceanibacterium hippocampi]|uniref:NADH oxidase n=1 Tax=Oceanibacterium hippocampi TaxID=745714 RepID=A0A1Y5TZD9_9PROT|nr:NADH:flavin oxidoreductase [Oceanibacterium hippocampi]SLN72038.1 NADH oxidase [Oceanibacterium hippocampi]